MPAMLQRGNNRGAETFIRLGHQVFSSKCTAAQTRTYYQQQAKGLVASQTWGIDKERTDT
jgi:hypothetical protein